MKCPIRYNVWVDKENKPTLLDQDCLCWECAWWRPDEKICAIEAIAGRLTEIDHYLGQIRDKMPEGGKA